MHAAEQRYNGNIGGTGTLAASPQHPLPSAIDNLHATINGLAATADNLLSRLDSVLTPTPGVEGKNGRDLHAAEPVTSSVVNQLREQAARIDRIVGQLNDATNRLEV